jgi:hypothetical protein
LRRVIVERIILDPRRHLPIPLDTASSFGVGRESSCLRVIF